MGKHHSISLQYFHIFTHTFHKVTPTTYYTHIFIIMGIIWHIKILFKHLSVHSILIFPLLLVIMKPLILVYCYYNECQNVLDTIEAFPHVELIIMRKIYYFYHVNTFINWSNVTTGDLSYSLLNHFPLVYLL